MWESQDADSPLFCIMFYIWKCVSVARKNCSVFHKHFHLISRGVLGVYGVRAAVIRLTHWEKIKPNDYWNVFFYNKKIHIFDTFAVVNRQGDKTSCCCSFLPSTPPLFFCRCLDCLKLKIILLLNSAVLVGDTLSGIQSHLQRAFRVIVLMLPEWKKPK